MPEKKKIAEMFNRIAPRYDFLNHFLSLGIDISWRKKAIGLLSKECPATILDVATGTGDFAIEALALSPALVTGIDISEEMIRIGKDKVRKLGMENFIRLSVADSENIPFPANSFHAVTVAFGVRNFENLARGLSEMHRVLMPGGKVIILEFSQPRSFPFRQIYSFYFKYILPKLGGIFSGDYNAYAYLPGSVMGFPHGSAFMQAMETAGFKNNNSIELTFGIASIYSGQKQK